MGVGSWLGIAMRWEGKSRKRYPGFWDVSLPMSCFTFCGVLDNSAISCYLLIYTHLDLKEGSRMMIRRCLGRNDKPMCMHVYGRNLQKNLFLLAQIFIGEYSHHHTAKDMHISLGAVFDNEFSKWWQECGGRLLALIFSAIVEDHEAPIKKQGLGLLFSPLERRTVISSKGCSAWLNCCLLLRQ